jgi:chromosome segregation ATPase
MDLFIDTACGSNQAKFVREALNDVRLNGKKSGKSSREIAAAFREHVELVESLRKDLKQSKSREKALVDQFTRKIEQLQRDSGLLPASFQVLASNTSFDGNDMPMDEMAETARMERSLRTIENIQQKSILEEYQKEMNTKMANLEEQTRNELLEKDKEIDRLKRVLAHRNRSEGMISHDESFKARGNTTPGILFINDESFDSVPGLQTSLNQTSYSSSTDDFVESISPLQRLRSRSNASSPTNAMIDWKKLSSILTASIVQSSKEDEINLSHEERKFVDFIKSLVDQLQETQIDVIESLKTELEMTNEELNKGEKKLGETERILDEKDAEIIDLKKLLEQTNDRLQNNFNLEGYMKMVSSGQKNDAEESKELKEKLRIIEEERDGLLASNAETEESIFAIQRVLADLSTENEEMKEKFESQIKALSDENIRLKNRQDGSSSMSNAGKVSVEENELISLSAKASEVDEMKKKLEVTESSIESLQDQLRLLSADEMLVTDLKEEIMQLRSMNDCLKKENEELKATCASNGISERDNLIDELKREKDELDIKVAEMKKELDKAFDSSDANEVLAAAKYAHAREQKLEEELREMRNLLDNETSSKAILKDKLESQFQEVTEQKHEVEAKLRNLRVEIIEMKEEKLAFKSRIKEAETALERTNRIMYLIQETNDSEGFNATGAISDLKYQLKEQQDLLAQLLSKGDHETCMIAQSLSGKVHTIQCLLETGIVGVAGNLSISKFDLNKDKSHTEYLLEQSLIFQRNENDRMQKKMKDLEAENVALVDQLGVIQSDSDFKSRKLSEKENELSKLAVKLKEAESDYISDDGSDNETEENTSKIGIDSLKELQTAKLFAEKEAKEAKENLANAKMIIASLEESNKKMNGDLRSRLNDSNAAIVSLLDQNAKYEKETQELKAQLNEMKLNERTIDLDSVDCGSTGNNDCNNSGENSQNDYIGEIDASFHDSETVDLENKMIDISLQDALA